MENLPKKIILMGYMASGKSRIGRELALQLNRKFIDLDDFIAEKEQMSISEVFEMKGELYFRKKELAYLEEILKENEETLILSLGGGTPAFAGAIELINNLSFSIYLQAGVQTLYHRLVPEKLERPLLSAIPVDALMEYIAKHLFERNVFYLKADSIISVENKNVEEIVSEIIEKLDHSR